LEPFEESAGTGSVLEPGAATGVAGTPRPRGETGGFKSWMMNRELDRYPRPTPRYLYLGVIIIASIILWYEYFIPTAVGQILLVRLHMSFRYLILILVLSQLAGTGAAIAGQICDRIGRCWVVIGGLGIVSAVQLFALPNIGNKAELMVVLVFIGLFEGIILVATPALVRDFSPQLGRASAMGFWTLGPVAGLLAATGITAGTLGATSSDWQREIIISGVAGLAIFVVALLFLRELAPPIRDQLMVSERDRVLVELKAKGVDVESALKNPWRQMLRFDIVISAIAVNVLLVLFYTASGTFPTAFFVTVFDKATHWSSLPTANGIAAWMWGVDCLGLVLCGILSDILRVRKPFMIAGAIGMLVFIPILISHAGHVTSHTSASVTSYFTVVWICSGIFFFQAMAYSTWMASFTETCEAHNPALIATGLSVWGGLLRFTAAIAYIFLPFLITSAGVAANNAYVAMSPRTVVAVQDIVNGKMPNVSDVQAGPPYTEIENIVPPGSIIQNTYPKLVAIAQAHPAAFNQAAKYPGLTIVSANPVLFHEILGYAGGSIATLEKIQKISPDLLFLNRYLGPLTRLEPTRYTAPREWQHWLWICFGCTLFFVPFVFVMRGRWSPRRAHRDEREHEEFIEQQLAQVRREMAPAGAGDVPET
jgi:MFS family permease